MNRLGRYFAGVIIALLLGSLITCVSGVFGLTRLERSLQSVVTTDVQRLMIITDLRRQIRMLSVSERDYLIEPEQANAGSIAQQITKGQVKVDELFAKYRPYLLPGEQPAFTALQNDLADWTRINARVLALAQAHHPESAAVLAGTHSKRWESIIKTLIENADKILNQKARETGATYRAAQSTVISVFVVSAVLGLTAGYFIYRGIRGMISEIVALKDRLIDANGRLEKTVDERTRTIRAILDHVRYGFFLIDRNMIVTDGYTRATLDLLGQPGLTGMAVADALGLRGEESDRLTMALEQVFDDLLPEELSCDQIPSRLERCGRVLRVQGSVIRGRDGSVEQILFGISDVTSLEAAERARGESNVLLNALKHPDPFRSFVADLTSRFDAARRAVQSANESSARRELHTIKGNASCFGLTELAKHAHAIEDQPRLELSPLADLEREFRAFLDDHYDILGIRGANVGDETYRIAENTLNEMESLIRVEKSSDVLRSTLAARFSSLRMRRAEELLGPIQKQVQRLNERLGKNVELRIRGGDVRLVPSRLKEVLSVLPHMIQNAIDHAFEMPGERLNKPEKGTLELGFEDHSEHWRITLSDDGRGINTEKLRQKAIARGILQEADVRSHEELCGLIFASNLSSRDNVSEQSGRGEGMAAVAEATQRCHGKVSVRSTPGIGTEIAIQIPKTAPALA